MMDSGNQLTCGAAELSPKNIGQGVKKLLYPDSVRLGPEYQRAWYNQGTMLLQAGEPAAAAVAFQRALAAAPREVDTLYNLALALSQQDKSTAAAHYYHRALAEAPADLDILYNLGLLYRRLGRYREALRYLRRVVELAPEHAPAYGHLATLLNKLEEKEAAITCFEKLLELNHKPQAARHMLSALRGESPSAPPAEYVAELFDQYADRFDSELMEGLGYRVPFLLAEMVREVRGEQMYAELLDLGCGTGLVGETFLSCASRLYGVDLAGKMVAAAREKGIYDGLYRDELLNFCRRSRQRFELLVAADVLTYMGDLWPFFQVLPQVLRPGGDLLCSLEEGAAGVDFALQSSGRYAHDPAYPERLAAATGLQLLESRRTALRREKEQWIYGWLYLLHRPPAV
ncbi:MAG: tetratricopeptide repeat protein [Desulfurivibrio sp.]|nr:tetratricopeptide repeat protein [Desulfurivibrio sp.]